MRLRIAHQTRYRYDSPVTSVLQMLRLTPRNHDGQYVASWRIDVSTDCRLEQHEDAFGNITHAFNAEGPFSELTVLVEGEVETRDTHGIVRGSVERFPPSLYMRETVLTSTDATIADFAAASRDEAGSEVLKLLHIMVARLQHRLIRIPGPVHAELSATEAFARERGACKDFAHIFIAAARCLGVPARYVGGYFLPNEGAPAQDRAHAWAEAFVPELGWVAFDPANGICATDAHVRVAIGLDSMGAAPLRGSRYGGFGEAMDVQVRIDQIVQQTQN